MKKKERKVGGLKYKGMKEFLEDSGGGSVINYRIGQVDKNAE